MAGLVRQIAGGNYDLGEPPADTAPWVGEMLGRVSGMGAALAASGLSQGSLLKVRICCHWRPELSYFQFFS